MECKFLLCRMGILHCEVQYLPIGWNGIYRVWVLERFNWTERKCSIGSNGNTQSARLNRLESVSGWSGRICLVTDQCCLKPFVPAAASQIRYTEPEWHRVGTNWLARKLAFSTFDLEARTCQGVVGMVNLHSLPFIVQSTRT